MKLKDIGITWDESSDAQRIAKIEKKKAELREKLRSKGMENFPHLNEFGTVRDKVAENFGISRGFFTCLILIILLGFYTEIRHSIRTIFLILEKVIYPENN